MSVKNKLKKSVDVPMQQVIYNMLVSTSTCHYFSYFKDLVLHYFLIDNS